MLLTQLHKTLQQSIASLLILLSFTKLMSQPSKFIFVDQFGYLSQAEKVAVISDPQNGFNAADAYQPGATLEIRNFLSEDVAYSGSPLAWNGGATHSQSGDKGWWFDFSSLTTPGTYYVYDPATTHKSTPFRIDENPYQMILNAAVRAFYYNRCNAAKEMPYAADGWSDGMNFNNTLQDAHCRFVYDQANASLEKDLTGGWFDAGDYNKYVTFAHHPVHQLLWAYEENSSLFGDDWNWPESGNGLSDLLDEIKWELDWLVKMTNADGSTHIKMGSIDYSDNNHAPPSANTDARYYGPTCTAASIAVASMFAHASKVFEGQPGMQSYSQDLLSRAIACWDYFMTRFIAGTLETACDDGTIKAGDADWSVDDQKSAAIVAAVHLFELTGTMTYNTFITTYYDEVEPISNSFWGPYRNDIIEALLLYTTLPGANVTIANQIKATAATDVTNNYNGFFALGTDDLYRAAAPDWMYHWGSNMPKANMGNLCHIMKKYQVIPGANAQLEAKAAELLHYFHGINPMGLVYLSNMYGFGGDRCANEIYHTWFNDGTIWDNALTSSIGPAPGFLVGGPNKDFSVGSLNPPSGQPPQKCYLDFNTGSPSNSWEITEPAIYYQAAYIRLLAQYTNTTTVTSTVNIRMIQDCIEIYPNPTNGFFHLRGALDRYKMEVYDSEGILHKSIDSLGGEAMVNISSLPAGTFLIRVENLQNHTLCVQKILKQN